MDFYFGVYKCYYDIIICCVLEIDCKFYLKENFLRKKGLLDMKLVNVKY